MIKMYSKGGLVISILIALSPVPLSAASDSADDPVIFETNVARTGSCDIEAVNDRARRILCEQQRADDDD